MARLFLPALIALCLLVLSTTGASAAAATLTVDSASVTADPDQTFSVTLKLHTDIELAGVQTNIIFDRAVLQIQDVVPSSAFHGASFIIGVAPNNTKPLAFAEANNTTGKVYGVATFFASGAGSVPVGDADFATVTFKAVAGGTSAIALTAEPPLHQVKATDTQGNTVPLTTTDGQVTVTGATPSPTPAGQTPSPAPTAAPTPTATPALAVQASMGITPSTMAVRPSADFTIKITGHTSIVTSGAQATLTFDPALLQVVSVSKGATFSRGSLIYGEVPIAPATPATGPLAISNANTDGVLHSIGSFVVPPNTIPAGDADIFTIKMKAKAGVSGSSTLALSNLEVLDSEGQDVGVTSTNGTIEVSASAPLNLPSTGGLPADNSNNTGWLVIIGGLLAVLAGGAAVYAGRGRSI